MCVYFFVFRRNNKSIGNLKLHFFRFKNYTAKRDYCAKGVGFFRDFRLHVCREKKFFDENTDYIRERRVFEAEI